MNFTTKLPMGDPLFQEKNSGWIMVDNFNNIIVKGVILGLVLAIMLDVGLNYLAFDSKLGFMFIKNIYLFPIVIIVHELLHWIALPKPLNATLGVSIKKGVFFVSNEGIFSRQRGLIILLLPFIVLSVLMSCMSVIYRIEVLAYIAIYNIIGSGVDLLMAARILKLTPKCLIQFNGEELYVKQL